MKEILYRTQNLCIAAFLLAQGEPQGLRLTDIVHMTEITFSGTFIIRGQEEIINQLLMDYQASNEKKFDDKVRYLKALCKQGLPKFQRK